MKEDLISVIVPIYNVDKYLNKCIQSIVNQTYKKLEIILVDDGSTDRSSIICDEWKKKDNRIKVIHQQNKGAGFARNVALDLANGDFITFVDSDDYISPIFCEYLLSLFEENVDIVECEYIDVYSNEMEINDAIEVKVEMFDVINAMRKHISDCYFKQIIWNKLYRANIVKNIYFPIDKKIDDEFWTYRVIGNSRKLVHSSKKLYAYRQQNSSVMHSIDIKTRIQGIDAKIERLAYIKKFFPELEIEGYLSLAYSTLYIGQILLHDAAKENKGLIVDLQSIFKNNNIKITKIRSYKSLFWIFLSKISFVFTCRIRNLLKIGI